MSLNPLSFLKPVTPAKAQTTRLGASSGATATPPAPTRTDSAPLSGRAVLQAYAPPDVSTALQRLSPRDRELYRKLDKALRDPETNVSLVAADLPKLLGTGGPDSRLLKHDTTGHTLLDTLANHATRPIKNPQELGAIKKAMKDGPELGKGALADVIHDLAHMPGTEVDAHTVFQGDGTNTCVSAVTQTELIRNDPAEYARVALGLFIDGSVTLRTGDRVTRDAALAKNKDGSAKLLKRAPLDAIFQDSLTAYALKKTNTPLDPGQTVETQGLTFRQLKVLQDSVLGGDCVVTKIDNANWGDAYNELYRYVGEGHHPIEFIAHNDDGGMHAMTVTGVLEDSTGVTGWLMTDPGTGFRYRYTPEQLANEISALVFPKGTTMPHTEPSDEPITAGGLKA